MLLKHRVYTEMKNCTWNGTKGLEPDGHLKQLSPAIASTKYTCCVCVCVYVGGV